MHDIINDISTWSILKWVIIVLVAGFIGQFGKSMAQAIMVKISFAKATKQDVNDRDLPKETSPKAEAPDSVMNNSHVPSTAHTGSLDKKTLKTLAKQEKKAAKLVKKGS